MYILVHYILITLYLFSSPLDEFSYFYKSLSLKNGIVSKQSQNAFIGRLC